MIMITNIYQFNKSIVNLFTILIFDSFKLTYTIVKILNWSQLYF
jgi:hypothetical protein